MGGAVAYHVDEAAYNAGSATYHVGAAAYPVGAVAYNAGVAAYMRHCKNKAQSSRSEIVTEPGKILITVTFIFELKPYEILGWLRFAKGSCGFTATGLSHSTILE